MCEFGHSWHSTPMSTTSSGSRAKAVLEEPARPSPVISLLLENGPGNPPETSETKVHLQQGRV